ncbi:MAG: His/Gly/Thr/Pro-type tRNA ligase C-terminal domain-containing protein, partial [Phycisphaerales bacterium JB037]
PRAAGSVLEEQRGIEVGHIFKLGTKYSDAMGFKVLDPDQRRQSVIMGCYGIGVSRTVASSIEQNHDENGIIWPAPIAPFHVHIVVMKPGDERQESVCRRLTSELADRGLDVFIDDRPERPGVKFKDADLIGLPVRITLGDKALDEDAVEFKRRTDEGKAELVPIDRVVEACVGALAPRA